MTVVVIRVQVATMVLSLMAPLLAYAGHLKAARSAPGLQNSFAIASLPVKYAAKYPSVTADERDFLRRLGFEDYATEAENTAKKIASENSVLAPILDNNFSRNIPLSYARELAVLARVGLERSRELGQENQALQALSRLTEYHLLPFSLIGLEPVPDSVFNFKVGAPAEAARFSYLANHTASRYMQEKKSLVSVLISMLFTQGETARSGEEVQRTIRNIDLMASEVLFTEYGFTGLQQSRYLGRALAATLLRYTRSHQTPAVEEQLRARLAAQGQHLENHVTSTLTFKDREGREHPVRVYNGDIANEYSTAAEAYQITAGVLPSPENYARAKELKLIGSLGSFGTALSDKLVDSAVAKRRSNRTLSDTETRVLDEIWDLHFIKGFSHAGLVEVRSDRESGISMVWNWDVYPNGNLGGVRVHTPENFAYAERYNRIGFVHYNPEKMLALFKRQIRTRGYLSTVWESSEAVLGKDADQDTTVNENKRRHVKRFSQVDAQTVQRWTQVPESEAQAWYYQEVIPRVMKVVRGYLTGEEAMVFASGFKNMDHSAYCSQMIVMAFLEGANLDPQSTPDDWRGVAKLAAKFTPTLPIKERVIAPAGFAWQKDLTQTVHIIDLDRSGVIAQTTSAPFLNGRLTVIDQKLQILSPLLTTSVARAIPEDLLTPIDPGTVDLMDDDL